MNRITLALFAALSSSSLLLVDSAIKGAVLLLLAATVTFLLRRDSAATRHFIWLLAILALFAVPLLSVFLPEWRVLPRWAEVSPETAFLIAEAKLPAAPSNPPNPMQSPPTILGGDAPPGPMPPLVGDNSWQPESTLAPPGSSAAEPSLSPAQSEEITSRPNGNGLRFLSIAWAIGCGALIFRLLTARFLLWRMEKRADLFLPSTESGTQAVDPLVEALESARAQLDVPSPVRLLVHPDKAIPVVFGILRPRLVLPVGARQWSEQQLRSVLLHELAHIKRRDCLAKLLAQIACACYWFHPLVWIAAWRLSVERERACDDLVLSSGVRPSAYAGHLLDVVSRYSTLGWPQSVGLAMARKSTLESRLIAVLSAKLNRRAVSASLAVIALTAGLTIAVPVAMLRAVTEKKLSSPIEGDMAAALAPSGSESFPPSTPDEETVKSTSKAGTWPLAGGIKLEVEQQLVHATDVSSTAILTWPTTPSGDQPRHKIWLGGDAFANRQPWLLVWEPASPVLWAVSGPLQSPKDFRKVTPKADTIRRIDFVNPEAITETTWNHAPPLLPKAIATEIAKHFLPLPTPLPIPEGGESRTMTSRAEDRRAIGELLHGSWKSRTGAAQVSLSFPKDGGTQMAWTIVYPVPTVMKTVTDKLTRVDSPNGESVRLMISGGKSGGHERMTIGQLKRGIGDTLLLDIWPHTDWPAYESAVGIVLQKEEKETPVPTLGELIGKPRSKSDQALFDAWRSYTREDGIFPGECLKHLRSTLVKFNLVNPTDERRAKFVKLLERIDLNRSWKLAEGDALIDELKAIDPAFSTWVVREMWMQGGYPFRYGKPLPAEMANVPWGKPNEQGLRAAWALDPKAERYPLGTVLKSRVLFHNSGKEPIAFRTPTWHQEPTHTAHDDKGNSIQVVATHWLGVALSMDTIILAPGHYAELGAHGISLGGRLDDEEYRQADRLGAWIMAKGGESLTFHPGAVLATDVGPPASAATSMTPEAKRKSLVLLEWIVLERISRQAPLPDDRAQREQVLRDLMYEFTGTLPTQEKIAAFIADRSPDALQALGAKLVGQVKLFTGTVDAADTSFRVESADPDAAKKARVETEPGRYKITENARVLVLRHIGHGSNRAKLLNEGRIEFLKPGAKAYATEGAFSFGLPDENEPYALGWQPGTPVLWVAEKGMLRRYDISDPAWIKETKLRTSDLRLIPEPLRAKLIPVIGIQEKGAALPKPPQDNNRIIKPGVLLPPATEGNLKWSEPVNGLRAALSRRASLGKLHAEEHRNFDLVVQNVSANPIRLLTTEEAPNPRRVRVRQNGETLAGFANEKPSGYDFLLKTGEAAVLPMFDDDYGMGKSIDDANLNQARAELDLSEKYLLELHVQRARVRDLAERDKFDKQIDKSTAEVELSKAKVAALTRNFEEKSTFKAPNGTDTEAPKTSKIPRQDDSKLTYYAEMTIAKAPEGAWTGRLVTPTVSGAVAAGKEPVTAEPKDKKAQVLFKKWQYLARRNGNIPGGAMAPLKDVIATFIKSNPTYEATPKLSELLKKFDLARDWPQGEAVALLDELSSIYPDLVEWIDTGRRLNKGGPIRKGAPLPKALEQAPWGMPHESGLRVAWLLDPQEKEHRLNSPLKSRILFQNTGKTPVIFRALTWNQSGSHKAHDAKEADLPVVSTFWTTLPSVVIFRLEPGEFAETIAAGIGVGANKDSEDWRGTRVGAWIQCKEGDELTFVPGPVSAMGKESESGLDGEPRWWLEHIQERLNLTLPLPAEASERERILLLAALELFHSVPTAEEIDAFLAAKTPEALTSLASRLAHRPGLIPYSGLLQSGTTKFRVLPVDPEAATRPRVATGPGDYPLSEGARLVIVRRPSGERIINDAKLVFSSKDPKAEPPKSQEIQLPDGYETWAMAWERGASTGWIRQQGTLRKVDFSQPEKVREESFEFESGKKLIPPKVLQVLNKAMENFPAAKPAPAASTPEPFNKPIGENR